MSSSESPSPLPQSSPNEVLINFSSSENESFKTAKNEQSLATPCVDNKASSNIDQVSATETSHLQPYSDESVYRTDESIIEPHTDWSRLTRKKIALLKSGSDHDQIKITSFYDLIDDVNSILSKHPKITDFFVICRNY